MYSWLKYVAFGLITLMCGAFIFDAVKAAKASGGHSRKHILVHSLLIVIVFLIFVVLNIYLNRNWESRKFLFFINPF